MNKGKIETRNAKIEIKKPRVPGFQSLGFVRESRLELPSAPADMNPQKNSYHLQITCRIIKYSRILTGLSYTGKLLLKELSRILISFYFLYFLFGFRAVF